MAPYKCPFTVSIIGDLPKNFIGKVQRRALQEADPLYDK
jgi:acyl-coenzyme A synthetase/AMP-(fatty) acid ligase